MRSVAYLTYKQYGGTGLNFTYSEAMELDVARLNWFCEWLSEQRDREARALKAAARRRKK